ncbi:MAG: helix-turn-helix domain-containing protein [Clostridia bacterium]|nr:helix-turn-helix domain-containing protein [Clostridia bacterium]
MTSCDYSYRRTGGGMTEHDFGETYTFLELFLRTYVVHEDEVKTVLQAILEMYMLEYNREDPVRALKALRNPRNAGRKKRIANEVVSRIRELHSQGHSIRCIADETGVPKSSVQRLLNEGTVP